MMCVEGASRKPEVSVHVLCQINAFIFRIARLLRILQLEDLCGLDPLAQGAVGPKPAAGRAA